MAGTQGTNTRTLADLNESEQALVAFKALLNEKVPQIFPHMQSWGKLLYDEPEYNESLNPLDPAFIDLLQQTIFDTSKRATNQDVKALHEAFQQLPDDVKSPITLSRQMFDAPSVDVDFADQATAVINMAQTYLDVTHTDGASIDQASAKALSIKINELQARNPDISVDPVPQYYDDRTVEFLDALVEKRMEVAKITPTTDVNALLTETWSQKQAGEYIPNRALASLAEAVSLRNMAKLMVNEQLPSGVKSVPVKVDAPWNTGWDIDTAPDRFFSEATYEALRTNTGEVSAATLFGDYSTNPNAALLREFAEKIDLDIHQKTFTQMDVGKLAAEMLAHQAAELCIPEHEVNNAIHEGRFMPHKVDLLYVDRGYGFPPGELSEAARYKNGAEQIQMEYYAPILDIVKEYRNVEFVNRFGGFSDEDIHRLQQLRGGPDVQFDREEGLRDFGSPSRYYASYKKLLHEDGLSEYEYSRNHDYLPHLSERYAEGTIGGMCRVPGSAKTIPVKPDNPQLDDGECTVEKALEDSGAPCEGDECTVESEIEQRIKSGRIKPCDDFSNGADAGGNASDNIQRNMSDVTGQSPDACTVEAEIARRLEGGELTRPCDTGSDMKLK